MFCKEEDEKERQSSFLSLFMKVDRHFMTKCFGQMQELGIYPGQIPVLGLLAYKDGLSQREIAEHMRIKPPTVNVTVQRLEKAGFLFRSTEQIRADHPEIPAYEEYDELLAAIREAMK